MILSFATYRFWARFECVNCNQLAALQPPPLPSLPSGSHRDMQSSGCSTEHRATSSRQAEAAGPKAASSLCRWPDGFVFIGTDGAIKSAPLLSLAAGKPRAELAGTLGPASG